MVFEESRSIRSFVGRIEPGDDIIEALTLLCDANDVGAAEVRVSGTVSDAELVRFDDASKKYATIMDDEGPFHVVHFVGNMARLDNQPMLRADTLLAGQGPAGQQLIYGQLRRAVAVDCEFVVQSYEDLDLVRKLDPATGRFPITSVENNGNAPIAPAPAAAAPARERRAPDTVSEPIGASPSTPEEPAEEEPQKAGAEASNVSWGDAMDASDDIKPASQRDRKPRKKPGDEPKAPEEVYGNYDFDEPILEAGDVLDHPKLGECRVIRVEDDDYAHIRLSRGQIRKLALEVVQLNFEGEVDGKKRWTVRVGR